METTQANLVYQLSSSTGTGNFGVVAINGHQTFDTAFGHAVTQNVFDYFISNRDANEWERGTGHMLDALTLVRDTVLEGSNGTSLVFFSAGTKDVTSDLPASKQVTTDTVQTITGIKTFGRGILIFPPAPSLEGAFTVATALGGTYGGGTYLPANTFRINSDNVNMGTTNGNALTGWLFTHNFGGTAMAGSRISLSLASEFTATPNAADTNSLYLAFGPTMLIDAHCNGTGLTDGTAKGSFGTANHITIAKSGAINLNAVGTIELNTSLQAGSSARYKNGIMVAAGYGDAVQGSQYDCAYALSVIETTVGWKYGFLIGPMNNSASVHPVATTGTLFGTIGSATVANGIDFSSYTFSAFSLKLPNMGIDGLGNYDSVGHIATNTFVQGSQFNALGSSNGSLAIKAPAAAGSNTLTFPAGTTDFSATGGVGQFVKQNSAGGAFTVSTVAASDVASGAALTKTDDTNVTLTLGGTPATALLKAASLTLGWTGTLAASRGGTGISSLGTGVATALGINVGSAGAFVTFGGALGTPSSGTLTNASGLPTTGLTGTLQAAQEPAHTGDVTNSAGSLALTLASVITAGGPTGSATVVPIITYDAKGRLTTVTTATITPAVGSITGLGTGVATALAINVGSAGAFVTFGGALGTPSSGVGTNLTGTASGFTAGNVTTNANLTGPITSVGNATSIASQTGTGTKFVVDTSPTIATPTFTTNFTSPLHIGSSGTTGTQLTFQTTSGNGTTDAFAWTGGNNGGTTFAILNATGLGLGGGSPSNILDIVKSQNSGLIANVSNQNSGSSAVAQLNLASTGGTALFQAFSAAGGAGFNWYWTGAGVTQFIAQNATGQFLFYTGASPTEKFRISTSGGIGVCTSSDPGFGMIYTNAATFMTRTKTSWTNGAGVAAGTLLTAPTAGNPTKWIPIDDNGTTRYIPAW